MGLRDRVKKRLPIFGAGGDAAASVAPTAAATATTGATAPASGAPDAAVDAAAPAEEPRAPRTAHDIIDELVKTNNVVVFMKGTLNQPRCGFSANASAILRSYGKPIASFDVLSDPEVRQGVKDYSQWPTIPQVYVGGEFLGGSDILMQMHQGGELKEVIDAAFAES
jgi:monothiol glutaredoxin